MRAHQKMDHPVPQEKQRDRQCVCNGRYYDNTCKQHHAQHDGQWLQPARSGDIQMVLKPGYIEGGATGTTHGLWYKYDAHIPLLFYGWGIKKGKTNRETYMTDIASTVAALLHIQMPSGAVGKVIEEVMK
jgi:hypothetical protein